MNRRWPRFLRHAGALLVLVTMLVAGASFLSGRPAPADLQTPSTAQYVGAAACSGCHQAEAAAWRGSQHAAAMQEAVPATVQGRFDNVRFSENGVTSTFFRKGSGYFVRTDGPDGRLADFEVKYTFGVYPLQQYLVPFPDGRMQALPIAWDSRPKAQGGQRWFHLYAGQKMDYRDPLHWTRLNQNWNYMCAGCHSTNLQRHYDPGRDAYASTWTDIGVGCESCHGPGSRHLAWARHQPGASIPDANKGLDPVLDERHGVNWKPDIASGNSSRSVPLEAHKEIETCAACHARGATLGAAALIPGHLSETLDPSLLRQDLYYADGQQQDEDYIYGSFLQSRMYAKGVTCSDCHDPHTGKLRAEGNALCAQCHSPAKYDEPAHHMHAAGSTGAQCVNCHMPARTYMSIDERRDHSIRIPRPDLSLSHDVPNACNGCHKDKGAQWAASAIEKHFGPARMGYQHFADALDSARRGLPGASGKLLRLAADGDSPDIARATAIAELSKYPSSEVLDALQKASKSPNDLLRSAALDSALSFAPELRADMALSLANDPALAVRIKAGRALADVPDTVLAPAQQVLRDHALEVYRESQNQLSERPEAHVNLGNVHALRGEVAQAVEEYRTAIRLNPDFVPAYVHLSDLYRSIGREDQVSETLAAGLNRLHDDAALLYFSGLQHARTGDLDAALPLLGQAAQAAPNDDHYAYVYAVALESAGQRQQAMRVLLRALRASPYSPELLSTAAAFELKAGNKKQAEDYRRRYDALTLN